MANKKHLEILKQGVEVWNEWRRKNPHERPDLSGAELRGANLINANLSGVDLSRADLSEASLFKADLRVTDLSEANLSRADLSGTNLSGANLRVANLSGAYLRGANFWRTDLKGALLINSDISIARMLETNLENTNLSGCRIYGISAWDLKMNEATVQSNLIITQSKEPIITVDNLEVAQFIYLLLYNEKIRHVIDTITSKVVLILGRFTPERKAILDAIREELRNRDYLPVLFDFQGPTSRDIAETISTLAHMARFIIADITDARSIPQELQAIVPNLPSVPVQPLLQSSKKEYGLFEHLKSYPWVLTVHCYRNLDDLMATLKEKVIEPTEAKVLELREKG